MFHWIARFTFLFLTLVWCNQSLAIVANEETLLRAYLKEKNLTKKYWRQLALGNFYQNNDLKKADSIRYSIVESSRGESDSARLQALIFDLKVDKLSGNKSAYYAKILQLQPYLSRTESKENQIKIFLYLSDYHVAFRQFEQADIYLQEALLLSKKLRNYALIAESTYMLSKMNMEENRRQEALDFANESIGYARRSSDKSLMARCMHLQASVFNFFGQVELSVSKNFIALQLAREAGDLPLTGEIQREIGEAQFGILNYESARRFFQQSKESAMKINDERLLGLANSDLGMIHLAKKEYDEAIRLLKSAIAVLQAYNDQDGLGKANMSLGSVYKELKNYDEALRYFNKSLVFYESAANKTEIAQVYHLVGTVFAKQGKYKNAINYLNRAIDIRKEIGNNPGTYPSYREMAEVYRKTGNLKLAYNYLEMYSNYTDSARIVEVSAKIAEISELYRSEQRERLIAIQADSIELQRKEKDLTEVQLENTQLRNIFQTYIIIGFLLILALGAFIVYNRWKQRNIRQLQREAEMQQTLLRSQMNPHFVFNAMSVIQSYIYDNDTKNSTKFLINFSKLMRLILENSSKEFIPVSIEIDILNKYLSMQKLRFGDRFEYDISIDKNFTEDGVVIPPMITQPFIENAIEHGQLHTIDGGFIHVKITKDEEMLHVMIEDNGVGRKGSEQNKKSKEHKSMAMKITQDRINNLSYKYKILGRMEIEDYDKENERGTLVNIFLPYKTESEIVNGDK